MTHYLNLKPQPFHAIRLGEKTIELRLLDEKRKLIQVGDVLIFKNTEDPDNTVTVQVIALHFFDSFEELYKALPLDKCGYTIKELPFASPADMEAYYSKEKQSQYGVVGIEIKLLTEGQK